MSKTIEPTITDEHIAAADDYPTLGPAYFRDALWNSDIGESVPPRLNKAYIEADTLIRKIEIDDCAPGTGGTG